MIRDEYEIVGFDPRTPCSPKSSGGRGPEDTDPLVMLQQLKNQNFKGEFDVYVGSKWEPACFSSLSTEIINLKVTVMGNEIDCNLMHKELLSILSDPKSISKLGIVGCEIV